MPSILFNNDNNASNGKKPDAEASHSSLQKDKVENITAIPKEDDFAIFPDWDLLPPNVIINPRIKKKL